MLKFRDFCERNQSCILQTNTAWIPAGNKDKSIGCTNVAASFSFPFQLVCLSILYKMKVKAYGKIYVLISSSWHLWKDNVGTGKQICHLAIF